MEDITGTLRSDEEIQEAINCVKTTMVTHSTELPLFTVHALLILDCLRELQSYREIIARLKRKQKLEG